MSMSFEEDNWQEELAMYIHEGAAPIEVTDRSVLANLESLAGQQVVPPGILVFAQEWLNTPRDPWTAMVGCALVHRTDLSRRYFESGWATPLRRIVENAQRAAILVNRNEERMGTDSWSYLLQVSPEEPGHEPGYLRFYLPVTSTSVVQAEAILGSSLPPSYVRFLSLTNGLDAIGEIAGAGSQRADWTIVTSGDWRDCWGMNEIVTGWRALQGELAEIRRYDTKSSTNSFQSDETVLVPFLWTSFGDAWCFDRSQQQEDGECPVVFWDHETWESIFECFTFAEWLDTRLRFEVYGED